MIRGVTAADGQRSVLNGRGALAARSYREPEISLGIARKTFSSM
jgi:hypothetical protein